MESMESNMDLTDLKKELNEIRGQLLIDPNNLEQECVYQPSLYERVGVLYSNAKAEAKIAKEHAEYEKARIKFEIRKNPKQFGIDKTTNDAVEEITILQPEYQAVLSESIELQKIADSLTVLLESAGQRKSMLKDLVSLYVYNYYSGNAGNTTQEVTKICEVTEQRIVQKMNQNRDREQDEFEENVNA